MNNTLGFFLKTLSSQANKKIKETLYQNEYFLNSRWSFSERSIVRWSTYYRKYISLMLFLACLVTTLQILLKPWVKFYAAQYIPGWKSFIEWQGVFLGGQLTIIGVVYPLVVGLISILFSDKSAKKVIFPLYQKYSGFMFAGLSGLALSGFIVAGYFLRAIVTDSTYVAVCITSALWFSFNLVLTAWFFVKTFRMLDETSCEDIIFRFSIHEACEYDVRRRIEKVLLDNALEHKLLCNPRENIMEVLTIDYSSECGNKIALKVNRKGSLKDVRLWLLNIAIRLQICILQFKKVKGGKLVIQPIRPSQTSDIMVVARYVGFEINPIVNTLIKYSFSFQQSAPQVTIGLSTVINGFIGPVNDAMRHGDAREFSDTLNNLILWHAELSNALSFKDSEGKLDNWLTLNSSGFWGRSYLDELLSEYYRLARDSVERIPDSASFYKDMLYFYIRVFSSRDALLKDEIRSLIQGGYYMWYLLVEWRSYSSESNSLRVANKYEDVIYDFVGAWENWLMFIKPRATRNNEISTADSALTTHLEFTASTAISALRFDNFDAAGWGVDMLINWFEKLTREYHWNADLNWHSVLVNHYFLTFDSTGNVWSSILKRSAYDHDAAFTIAFKNAHIDLRVITACYMLLKPGGKQPDLLTRYVNALLSGTRIHPSGNANLYRHDICDPGELLGSYIRQCDYCSHGENKYGVWLSSILESFGRLYEERLVSGRVYSGWGANDLRIMNKSYVEIAISMSDKIWGLPSRWEDAIFSDLFKYRERQSIISDLKDWIKIANETDDYLLIDSCNIQTLKANFIESVEGIIKKISDTQRQLVDAAEIDKERLTKLGITSSSFVSDQGKKSYPLTLFEHFEHDADIDENSFFRLSIGDYDKERVALGIETYSIISEVDFLAEFVTENIKTKIFRELTEKPKAYSYNYTDVHSILSDISQLSESMACPVLFVGNQHLESILHSAPFEQEVAEKYNITRRDGFDAGYICHIGNCEVCLLSLSNVDYSLLTSAELFDTIGFRKIADEQYIDADFKLNEGSTSRGKLILRYWMKIKLAEDVPCIKLELMTEDIDSSWS